MRLKTGIVVVGMLLALAASQALRPKPLYDKQSWPQGRLDTMVPKAFGPWQVDPAPENLIVSPDQKLWLNKLYSDTLTRTYVDKQGSRIMLSIAYGADQGRAIQLHKPEVCYEAQGFKLTDSARGSVHLQEREVPIVHLLAKQGTRAEPLTYWIRTGDVFVRSAFEQQWARLKSGLFKGHIPDGILVRVSTIDDNKARAFAQQEAFMQAMLAASPATTRHLLIGDTATSP
jgi:EpsI family protein